MELGNVSPPGVDVVAREPVTRYTSVLDDLCVDCTIILAECVVVPFGAIVSNES